MGPSSRVAEQEGSSLICYLYFTLLLSCFYSVLPEILALQDLLLIINRPEKETSILISVSLLGILGK